MERADTERSSLPQEPSPHAGRGSSPSAWLQLAGVSACLLVVAAVRGSTPAPPVAAATAQPSAAHAEAVASGVLAPSASPEGATPASLPKATCVLADRGYGPFARWRSLGEANARLLAPEQPATAVDLLLHFHGSEAVRKVMAQAAPRRLAIVGVDAGNGSKAYDERMYDPQAFERLLQAAEAALSPSRIERVYLSAWSAGYAAIRQILRQSPTRPAGVILLDAVHSDYAVGGDGLNRASLRPFEELFVRAAAGKQQVALSHSEIRPPNFASTKEVADHLLQHVGGQRSYAGLGQRYGLRIKTSYRRAGLRVEGYTGKNKAAHCAHLPMLPRLLQQQRLGVSNADASPVPPQGSAPQGSAPQGSAPQGSAPQGSKGTQTP